MSTTLVFRLVGFDADYTLIDPRPGRKAAWAALLREHGFTTPVTDADVRELSARSARGLIARRLSKAPEVFGGQTEEQVWARFVLLEQQHSSETLLMPGALNALHGSLGRNTIISRSPVDLLMQRTLAALDNALAGRTDQSTVDVATKVADIRAFLVGEQQKLARGELSVIVAADSAATGRGKPFGDPITAAFTHLSRVLDLPYDPERCLLVGDSNEDACSGILAGVMTLRARVSDNVLGDVFELPTWVTEHLTVPDLTDITLSRDAQGDVLLRTDARIREVNAATTKRLLWERLSLNTDTAPAWPPHRPASGPQSTLARFEAPPIALNGGVAGARAKDGSATSPQCHPSRGRAQPPRP